MRLETWGNSPASSRLWLQHQQPKLTAMGDLNLSVGYQCPEVATLAPQMVPEDTDPAWPGKELMVSSQTPEVPV